MNPRTHRSGAGHPHDRAAGRDDEGDGQRVQRVRALARDARRRVRAQRPRDRGGGPVSPIGRHAIEIVTSLDPALGQIEADRGRVRQILNNLLTNSMEALEGVRPARIEVVTEFAARDGAGPDGAGVAVISVSDNGPGFQRELLPRIFDPYVTSKPRGTGLGSRHRQEDRRRARGTHRGRQPA
jgi:signal transduction histidine kinase